MITMKDTCQLADTSTNGYGDKTVNVLTEVACLFLQKTGNSHSNNADIAESDAHIYLDIDNPLLISKGYDVAGMYIIINPFGQADKDTWYRISRVEVGQRKLLDNNVDNVHAYLRKVAPLGVGNVS